MEKKFTKVGNSWAIIIEKPLMRILGIDENTTLDLSTNGRMLMFEPRLTTPDLKIDRVSENEKVQKAYEKVLRRYDAALRRLAKK